jgi:hypothetical protein
MSILKKSKTMKTLKKEFIFNYKGQDIKVKLLGSVYCAIFGEIAKPLIIEDGKIYLKEGKKFLSNIPDDAFVNVLAILESIKELLKDI